MISSINVSSPGSISGSTLKSKSLTVGSARSLGTGSTAAVASLKMERNLLERMVQERDEKISSLQKSIEVQNDHVNKMQARIETSERREKQIEQRHKLKVDNLNHEKSMLKSQLQVMHGEIRRISDDPIHHALNINGGGRAGASNVLALTSEEDKIMSQLMPAGNPFGVEKEQSREQVRFKLANSAQGVLLQKQLYQAMNSLKQLREQTAAMKKNYDEIVTSLQQDFVLASDAKARVESELLSQLSLLDQNKKISERSLEDQLVQKDARIRRLEKRLRSMDDIDDEEDMSADDSAINNQLSFSSIGGDSLGAKSIGDANFSYRTQFQDKKPGLGERELEAPYSMSSQNVFSSLTPQSGAVFREASATSQSTKPSSSMSAASLLLQQSQSRAYSILRKTSMRSSNSSSSRRGSRTPSIVEEEEEDDDEISMRSSNSSSSRRGSRTSPSIVEEEEEEDDDEISVQSHAETPSFPSNLSQESQEGDDDDTKSVQSYVTTASEAASATSNLLQGSRARAMKLLSKAVPEPPQEITQVLSIEIDDLEEITQVLSTEIDDFDIDDFDLT